VPTMARSLGNEGQGNGASAVLGSKRGGDLRIYVQAGRKGGIMPYLKVSGARYHRVGRA